MNKKYQIKTNYHTHSDYSGHADGCIEDYIKTAIENNYEILGMSEHCYFDDKSICRYTFDHIKKYLKEVEDLKIKYKDKIKILNGLEIDYFRNQEKIYDYYFENLDYMMMSVHYLPPDEKIPNYRSSYGLKDFDELEKYKNLVIEGIKTNQFSIIAHPDIYIYGLENLTDKHREVFEEICKCCADYDVALEFNANGLRSMKNKSMSRSQVYPNKELFELTKKYKTKVIIGNDCHNPILLNASDYELNLAFEEAISMGLNLITEIKSKNPKKR